MRMWERRPPLLQQGGSRRGVGPQRGQQSTRSVEAGRGVGQVEGDAQLVRPVHAVVPGLALDQADHRHRVDVGFLDELQPPALGTEVELADAQRVGLQLQLGCGEQVLHLRSEEHTSELQSLMRISYAVFCLTKKITQLYYD